MDDEAHPLQIMKIHLGQDVREEVKPYQPEKP